MTTTPNSPERDADVGGAGWVARRRPRVRPPLDRDRTETRLAVWLPPTLVFAGFIGGWYFISYLLLTPDRRFLLPPPHNILTVAFLNWQNAQPLLNGLVLNAETAGLGLAVSIVVGMLTAIVMSQARWLERSIYPYAVALQTIPILALVPVIGFWFGYGFTNRVLVCVLISLFPIIANTLFGLRSVDADHHDLFTLHHAGRLIRLWKLQLPAALPAIFAGFRISAGLSVIGAIVGDFFFTQGNPGLGVQLDTYRRDLLSEQMFGAVILASGLGIAVFWFFGSLSNRVLGSWSESARDRSAARPTRRPG